MQPASPEGGLDAVAVIALELEPPVLDAAARTARSLELFRERLDLDLVAGQSGHDGDHAIRRAMIELNADAPSIRLSWLSGRARFLGQVSAGGKGEARLGTATLGA